MKLLRKLYILLFIIFAMSASIISVDIYASETKDDIKSITIIQKVSEDLFGDVIINSIEYLYNLDDDADYVYVTFENSGYAIYSSQTLDLLEYSFSGRLPYSSDNKKYYFGPKNYFNKIEGQFKNVLTGETLSDNKIDFYGSKSKEILLQVEAEKESINLYEKDILYQNEFVEFRNSDSDSTSHAGGNQIEVDGFGLGAKYIDNYEYFTIGPHHGKNENGTCSAIASQIMLGYHNYYSDRRIIDNKHLFSGEEGPNTCLNPMKITSKIIGTKGINEDGSDIENSYFAKVVEAIPKSSGADKIVSGLETLLNERQTELNINSDFAYINKGNNVSRIKTEIDAGRPIIITMHNDTFSNHSVVGYGYQTLGGTGIEEDGQFGYIVHYGWAEDNNWDKLSKVWINEAWCYGWVSMEVYHTHEYGSATGNYFERACICGHRISDFPFDISITNGKVTIINADFNLPDDFIIPTKIDNYPVTRIAANAFSNSLGVKSLKIPNTVEEIELGAFSGFGSLETISLPFVGSSNNDASGSSFFGFIFGVESYSGAYPIQQNNVTYYIPLTLDEVIVTKTTNIKDNAFENCDAIMKVVLPYGLTNIGNYAFNNCSSLSSINIPHTVISIGNEVFTGCNNLGYITIPYSVKNIGLNPFSVKTNVNWVYNPEITASDINILTNLKTVEVRTGVTEIGTGAFANCTSLAKVTIGENVSSIALNAFNGCTSLNTVIWNYNQNHSVADLGGGLDLLLTDVNILNGVTKIKDKAFENCINLKNVTIREHVYGMGEDVFIGCTSLKSVKWYYNPYISARDLKIENILTDVSFCHEVKGEPLNNISPDAFVGCTKLLTLNIPVEITGIYDIDGTEITKVDLSFAPNAKITLNIPKKIRDVIITSIGENVFRDCTNLTEVLIPDDVKEIKSGAFNNCVSLVRIILPSSLRIIEEDVFRDCVNLAEVIIPDDVKEIKSGAFENCSNLEVIYCPLSMEIINSNAFKGCIKLTEVDLSEYITEIGSSAFENCANLGSVILPPLLKTIGDKSFRGCVTLDTIEIPKTVLNIGSNAFEDCLSLKIVTINRDINNITNLGNNVFQNCTSLLKISVPNNKVFKYKNAENWINYTDKIYFEDDYMDNYIDCKNQLSLNHINVDVGIDTIIKINVECSKSYKFIFTTVNQISVDIYNALFKKQEASIVYKNDQKIVEATIYLSKGIYYLDIFFVNELIYGRVSVISNTIWPTSISSANIGSNNFLTHLHRGSDGKYSDLLRFEDIESGFYMFKLILIENNNITETPEGSITIYKDDDKEEILEQYSLLNYGTLATSKGDRLIVFLNDYYGSVYIDVVLDSVDYSSVQLIIEKVNQQEFNLFNMNDYDDFDVISLSNNKYDEHLVKIAFEQNGIFEVGFIGFSEGVFLILEEIDIGYGEKDYRIVCNKTIISLNEDIILNEGVYYIGYIGSEHSNTNLFKVTRLINPNSNISMYQEGGSEVTINGGSNNGNIITQGFTRLIYLSNGESRLNYNWYTSNEEVSKITTMGTLIALNVEEDTEIKIIAVSKNDPSIVIQKDFIIKKEMKNQDEMIIISNELIVFVCNINQSTQIDISSLNVPINWLQYYTWTSSNSKISIDQYGMIMVSNDIIEGVYDIIGEYNLNKRITVIVKIEIVKLNN